MIEIMAVTCNLLELLPMSAGAVPCWDSRPVISREQTFEIRMGQSQLHFVKQPQHADIPPELERNETVRQEHFWLGQTQCMDEMRLQMI